MLLLLAAMTAFWLLQQLLAYGAKGHSPAVLLLIITVDDEHILLWAANGFAA